MEPSTEIKDPILQLYNKVIAGEVFIADRFYACQEGVLVIGSDPNEWGRDHDSIIQFYKATSASGMDIKINTLEAYRQGTVEWAIDRVMAKLPDGVQGSVRHTHFLHQEKCAWKIVQAPISLDIPN